MKKSITILFFGSTSDSVIVADALRNAHYTIAAAITQPPRPIGRQQILTSTSIAQWALTHAIPVLTFESDKEKPWLYQNESSVIYEVSKLQPDLIISASYGQKIPTVIIQSARFGGLNIHPSLLPRWRGADPVPWAILSGDTKTGVTTVTLAEKFDQGRIITQKEIPITDSDFAGPLRTKLFKLGATMLISNLDDYIAGKISVKPQMISADQPYAARLKREDAFEPWETIQRAIKGDTQESIRIERKYRALHPWPGVWTVIKIKSQKLEVKNEEKRLKILSVNLQPTIHNLQLDLVQLEGKNPVSFKQFREAYLS